MVWSPEAERDASMLQRGALVVALTGWYLFALTGPFSTTGVDFALLLILVGSLPMLPRIWNDLRREPVFWAAVALTAYLAVQITIKVGAHPELDEMRNPHWSHWFRVAGLWSLLLGWWLYRCPRHVGPLLVTMVAGLLLGIFADGNLERIFSGELWHRHVWGYSPNYLGMVSGMGVLAILAWVALEKHGNLKWWEWCATGPVFLLLALLLYSSASRSAWLAFPLGVLPLLAYAAYSTGRISTWRAIPAAFLLLAGAGTALYLANPGYLAGRMTPIWDVLVMLVSLDLEGAAAARGSLGLRVEMWLAGVQAFLQEPWFGWGPGSGYLVIWPDDFTDASFRHFHNLYVEILVSFGLVGALLFLATHFFIYSRSIKAMWHGAISPAMSIGLAGITLFLLAKLFSEIRIGQTEGRALLTAIYAFHAYLMFRYSTMRDERN